MSLKLTENRVYWVDQLLKDKPDRLDGLEIMCNEKPDNYSIDINYVNVFCRRYNIIYGESYVIIEFLDNRGNLVANISAFGSNEHKQDECFIVTYGSIISQTCQRRINDVVTNAVK